MGNVCKTCGKPVGILGKVVHAGEFYHSKCFEQRARDEFRVA